MNVYDILNLLGGIALFLFGMHTLSASLEKLAGGKLETWLEKATSKPIKGVVLGAIITAVIQSSAATTVMIIGFVNSGLMKLSQAIGVIMGANIGTTATSWLLSLQSISGSDGFSFLNLLKPTTFTPVLAVIGVILIMFTKSDKKKTRVRHKVNKKKYLLLCLFLGWCGGHRYYEKRYALAAFYTLFFWSVVPFFLCVTDLLIALPMQADENGDILI